MSLSTYVGPLAVTLAYILLYYGFVSYVGVVKTRLAKQYRARGEVFHRYNTPDATMLAADRMQLNTLEQMPPFLILLWLNAVFVSPGSATIAGGIYLLSRALYPVVMGARLGKGIPVKILAATVPGYLVIFYFVGRLGVACVAAL